MRTLTHRHARRGFSLIELLIAMVVLSLVMGSALTVFRSQSRYFRMGGTKMDLTQNIRYAVSTVDRVLRTTGAGTAPNQPMFIYGSNDAIVFNANFASDIPDGNAVYVNPDLPVGAIDGMVTATQMILPGTAIAYPQVNYFWGAAIPTRAETIAIYFRPDSTTAADPNDYVLVQRVNAMAPELIARNIRAYPGRPFFEYWFDSTLTASGLTTWGQVAVASIPIRHTANLHGDPTDVGPSALADRIRMVRINLVVTNGVIGVDSSSRRLSTMIRIPNNGLMQLKTCGDIPILAGALVATPNAVGTPAGVNLSWTRSVDELAGERDVSQYNIYYRVQATPPWATFLTVPAGQPNYNLVGLNNGSLVTGVVYEYAVAAVDCSPAESSLIISAPTIVNP